MIFGKMKSLLAVLALALLLAPAAQAAPAKLSSAWMGEHETFVAWYAKQQGWDKEAGLDLTMMPFDSGKNIVESLAAYDWAVAGCGAVDVYKRQGLERGLCRAEQDRHEH